MQEQVQQQPVDLCDDEDVQLLSPIQTASASEEQKAAPKQQKAQQPRKPRQPAWKAEAIRQEAERAKAYFSEVCNIASMQRPHTPALVSATTNILTSPVQVDSFELQEELASPEPLKQLDEQYTLPVAAEQEDTENVPPPDDGIDVSEFGSVHQVATPAQPSVRASQGSRSSVINTTTSIPPPVDHFSIGAVTPSQHLDSAQYVVPQPSAHYTQCFRRDSIWSCESEEQHICPTSAAAERCPAVPLSGTATTPDIIANSQQTAEVRAGTAVASGQCVARSSMTSSEAALFRSATDMSLGTPSELLTPSEVFVTPSGDARATPLGAPTVQQHVRSASTPGATAPLFPPDLSFDAEDVMPVHEQQSTAFLSAIAAQASDLASSPASLLRTPSSATTPATAVAPGAFTQAQATAVASHASAAGRNESTPPAVQATKAALQAVEPLEGQLSACIHSDTLAQLQASCDSLPSPAPIGALLQSEGSLKHAQVTPTMHRTPLASVGATPQPSGATSASNTQSSACLQQGSALSLPAQPVSAEIESPASLKLSPTSCTQQQQRLLGGAAAASGGDAPVQLTPPNQARPQSGTQQLSAVATALLSPASSIGASPASVGTCSNTHSAQRSYDLPEAHAASSCDVPSASAQSQPSAVCTRSTTRRAGSSSAKRSDSATSLPEVQPVSSAHTQRANSAMQHTGGVGVTPAATPSPPTMLHHLQGTTVVATGANRRSIIDAAPGSGACGRLSLRTPPHIHVAASSSAAASSDAVQADPVIPPDSVDAVYTDSITRPAEEAGVIVDSSAAEDILPDVQTKDSSTAAAPSTAPRKSSAVSQRSTPPAHPCTGPTPEQFASFTAESSSVDYASQSARSVRNPSYTPAPHSAKAAEEAVPHTRVATRATMRVAHTRTTTSTATASARSSGRSSGTERAGTASSGAHTSRTTPHRSSPAASAQCVGSVEPVMSESTDYGPPPPSAARSSAAARMSAQRSESVAPVASKSTDGVPSATPASRSTTAARMSITHTGSVAPVASKSTDEGPPGPPATCTPAQPEHSAAVESTAVSDEAHSLSASQQPGLTAACPSAYVQPSGSQLFAHTQCETQWTLSANSNGTHAQNAESAPGEEHAQSRQKEQPDAGVNKPQKRMSLAFSRHTTLAVPNAAAPSQQPRASISGQKSNPAASVETQAAPGMSPAAAASAAAAAASRASIAESSVTPGGPSSASHAPAFIARRALRNSLGASVTPASAAPSPSSTQMEDPASNAASAALATPQAASTAGRPPRRPATMSQNAQQFTEAAVATGPASEPDSAAGARKAPTPIPSKRDQQRLKARASTMFTNVPAHRPQITTACTEQAPASAASNWPPVTPYQNLPSAAKRSGGAGTSGAGGAHHSPYPRTALLTRLLQQGAQLASAGQQGMQQAVNIDIAATRTPPQTPPSLQGSIPGGRSSTDDSPIRQEQPAHSAAASTPGSSVVEVAPDGTPVATPAARMYVESAAVAAAAVPVSLGRVSAAPGTAQSPQPSGVSAAVAARASACMQPVATPVSSARPHTDAAPMHVPSARASVLPSAERVEAPEAAAVQGSDTVSCMGEYSEDTAVKGDIATGFEVDDEVSEPLTPLEELLMLCNQVRHFLAPSPAVFVICVWDSPATRSNA